MQFIEEYTGDSDSDGYVMGENDDFDAAVNENTNNTEEKSIENDACSPKENDESVLPKGTSVKREQSGGIFLMEYVNLQMHYLKRNNDFLN